MNQLLSNKFSFVLGFFLGTLCFLILIYYLFLKTPSISCELYYCKKTDFKFICSDDISTESEESCLKVSDPKTINILMNCGNGIFELQNEECDDGNNVSGDGCSNHCMIEELIINYSYCGNKIKDSNEQCDDGNYISGDGCSDRCLLEFCGDIIVNNNGIEECDDGNKINQDNCRNNCTRPFCGDNIIDNQLGERCDGDARCTMGCRLIPIPMVDENLSSNNSRNTLPVLDKSIKINDQNKKPSKINSNPIKPNNNSYIYLLILLYIFICLYLNNKKKLFLSQWLELVALDKKTPDNEQYAALGLLLKIYEKQIEDKEVTWFFVKIRIKYQMLDDYKKNHPNKIEYISNLEFHEEQIEYEQSDENKIINSIFLDEIVLMLSHKKRKSILLFLNGYNINEISKQLGLRADLVRKWFNRDIPKELRKRM